MTQHTPQYLSYPLFEEAHRLELELQAMNDDPEIRLECENNQKLQTLWANGEHQIFGVYRTERAEDNFNGRTYVCWCGLIFEWPFDTDAPLELGWVDLPGHRTPDGSPSVVVRFTMDGVEYVSGTEQPRLLQSAEEITTTEPPAVKSFHPNAFRIQRLAFNPSRFLAEATPETDPEELEALKHMLHLQERRAHGHMGFGSCSCFSISPVHADGSLPTGIEVMHGGVHIDPIDKVIGVKVFVIESMDEPGAFKWFCQVCGTLPDPAERNDADTDWQPINHGGHSWPLRDWRSLGQPNLDH